MSINGLIFQGGFSRQFHTSPVNLISKIERSILLPVHELKKTAYVHPSANRSWIAKQDDVQQDTHVSYKTSFGFLYKRVYTTTKLPEKIKVKVTRKYTQVVRSTKLIAKLNMYRVDPATKKKLEDQGSEILNNTTGTSTSINRTITRSYKNGRFTRLAFRTTLADKETDKGDRVKTKVRTRILPDPNPKAPPGSVIFHERRTLYADAARPYIVPMVTSTFGDVDDLDVLLKYQSTHT